MSGAIGGGFILAGFGAPWGIVGMTVGALAGWWVERRLATRPDSGAAGARGRE